MSPFFPLSILIPLSLAVAGLAAFASWRGSAGLTTNLRLRLIFLRVTAIAGLCAVLLNPGKWVRPGESRPSPWLVLHDVSASMTTPTQDGSPRAATASRMIQETTTHAEKNGLLLRTHPFAGELMAAAPNQAPATGTASRILPAITQAIQDSSAAGETLAGLLVLSDGRQTEAFSQSALDSLSLLARSRNIAIHTVAIGADSTPPDLALIQPRASLTAFAGQSLRIPFALQSTGLAPSRPTVVLRDASGAEISSLSLDLPPGKTLTAAFTVKAPPSTAHWTLETPVLPGEVRPANNRSAIAIRVVSTKTRVFLVEGAPYWDSKFLAQLLRQQPHMDVRSVHRLSDQRYFRIDSGNLQNQQSKHPVFPDSLDELCRYDLVVFGKNVDPFLSPERTEMLRTYVRDHGGAVLFSRGKPTTAANVALEPLEPVTWGTTYTDEFRFAPNRDGESAGLFGQALPAPDASLWAALPPLNDGRAITMVKPFTRVLADGLPASANALSNSGKFPALLVRRYGQGVTGLVNGDGLWKWDFFPEARELGNCYEDFWTQLIQWMASYSEFLPGQDFSLRLPASRCEISTPLAASISYRGASPVPRPILLVTSPDGRESRITPAPIPAPDGHPLWRATLTPDQPGAWSVKVIDPRSDAPATPETLITVPTPPTESDDLSPDPALLAAIAKSTGGQAITPDGISAFLKSRLTPSPPASHEADAVWHPSWNHPIIAMLLAVLLSAEWFLRRRNGLA